MFSSFFIRDIILLLLEPHSTDSVLYMKFSTEIILLVIFIFGYSATLDLTVGDLYSHFLLKI